MPRHQGCVKGFVFPVEQKIVEPKLTGRKANVVIVDEMACLPKEPENEAEGNALSASLGRRGPMPQAVIRDDGVRFESAREAASAMGCVPGTIWKACNQGTIAFGHRWAYEEDSSKRERVSK